MPEVTLFNLPTLKLGTQNSLPKGLFFSLNNFFKKSVFRLPWVFVAARAFL